MPRPDQPMTVRAVRGVDRLRRRREVEWLALYLGAAWIIYESVGLTVDTFDLSVTVVRVTAVILGLGALIAIPLAHWYELTARALEKAGDGEVGDVRGVPDVLESAFTRSYRKVNKKTVVLAGAGSTVLFSGFFFVLWTAWAAGHDKPVTDSRISMVVFPFRGSGVDAAGYGEGLADLLSVTFDGTPGVRVADPSAVWNDLRPERGAAALAPEPDEALRLSRKAGVRRYVTGNVVVAGASLDVTARVYDVLTGDVLATVKATAPADSISAAVNRLAIDLLADIWEREQLPTVPEIERYATDNAEALKTYLEAKSLARRGMFDEAEPLIEQAIALDSTFALAHLEHFKIREMILYLNAQPFIGIRPIINRAMAHRERLTPRNRMQIEAFRALDDTDGVQAAFLFERILSIDSLDVEALHGIAFTHLRDGWQLNKSTEEIVASYDRLIRVDSSSIAARASRARLALFSEDPAELQGALESLQAVDTSSTLALATMAALETLLAPEAELDSTLSALADQPLPIAVAVLRELVVYRPDLAERLAEEMLDESRQEAHRVLGTDARLQIWLAQGRLAEVDSLVRTGGIGYPMRTRQTLLVAQLAGVGNATISAEAIPVLNEYLPIDSLNHYFYNKPAWLIGWAVGAYHATYGDTTQVASWQQALEALPGGGTPLDYRAALSSDIGARLAVRRGDLDTALEEARNAYGNWQIHSNNPWVGWSEYSFRFHLAEILDAQGLEEQAEWIYRSFAPPYGWVSFFTARSSYELGRIEETRGNRQEAIDHYLRAIRLWERGDPEVVGQWLARAQEGLDRLQSELAGP
jgi:tetratricopeptide (TPR) repeat protein